MTKPIASANETDLVSLVAEDGFLFESPTGGFAGHGIKEQALIAWAGDLSDALSEVREFVRMHAGSGPAFIHVPFDHQPIRVVVAEETHRGSTVLDIESGDSVFALGRPVAKVVPTESPERWAKSVNFVLDAIARDEVKKVVLARQMIVERDAPFSVQATLRELTRVHQTSYRYAFDGFVGASPELLIARSSRSVASRPLAGTISRVNGPKDATNKQRLLSSAKDNEEHQILVAAIREALAPYCESLAVPENPELLSFPFVHHLATPIAGILRDDTDVLELLGSLHPTPAVAGAPRSQALRLIETVEPDHRYDYAGAIGWVDANGDGEFAIAIRGARIDGNKAEIWAGAGIVAGSDPELEFAETEAKAMSMLTALR